MNDVIVSFPIKADKFQPHTELKQNLLNAIAEQKECENVIAKGTDISRCDWTTSKRDWNRKWVNILQEPLQTHLLLWCSQYSYNSFDIREMWFQQYTTGGSHNWHTHSSNFTNVYYLDLPDGSPKTEWIDPITSVVHSFDIEEGDIITFPSFLVHKAPLNHSHDVKTIISWNMDISINDLYREE